MKTLWYAFTYIIGSILSYALWFSLAFIEHAVVGYNMVFPSRKDDV
jgi:hypothetical protein